MELLPPQVYERKYPYEECENKDYVRRVDECTHQKMACESKARHSAEYGRIHHRMEHG